MEQQSPEAPVFGTSEFLLTRIGEGAQAHVLDAPRSDMKAIQDRQ